MSKPAPVAVALDAPDLETAARWAALVTPHVSTVKVGLELYLRYGPQVVATVRGADRMVSPRDRGGGRWRSACAQPQRRRQHAR